MAQGRRLRRQPSVLVRVAQRLNCACPLLQITTPIRPRARIDRPMPRRHCWCGPVSHFPAHTTNVVTIDVWLEIPRRPVASKAQRLNPISTNVVTIASTPATKGVTRCAVSTKVVTQCAVARRSTVAMCKVEDLFMRRDHVTAHRMSMCPGSHNIS
jgi:hypothetical protein